MIVVAGGGIAGISAAVRLARAGERVVLLERHRYLGGRTHAFTDPRTGDRVDNGQHILTSGYDDFLEFLSIVGSRRHVVFDEDRTSVFHDPRHGLVAMRAPKLPRRLAGVATLAAMLRLRNVTLRDRVSALRAAPAFARLTAPGSPEPPDLDTITADALLERLGIGRTLRRAFWDPFIVSTLNEKPDRVSALLFVQMLRWGARGRLPALGYPRVDLSELVVDPSVRYLEARGSSIRSGATVTDVVVASGRVRALVLASGEEVQADAFVLALDPSGIARLAAAPGLSADPFFADVATIGSAPIVCVNLWLARPLRMQRAFEGLLDSPIEWVFDRARMHGATPDSPGPRLYTLIVSAAWELTLRPAPEIIEVARRELARFFPDAASAGFVHASAIKQRDATFSGVPGFARKRLPTRTSLPNLFLAGDWTDTGLPSTMEGAAVSAKKAVDALQSRA